MENRRQKGNSDCEKAEMDADRSDLSELESDPDEIAQLISRIENNREVVTEQPFEDLNAAASAFLDEEPADQATYQASDPKTLIESISPKAPKSHILRRLSEDLPHADGRAKQDHGGIYFARLERTIWSTSKSNKGVA